MSNNIQDTDVQQGRKCSLWQLAAENAIVIPIIQRDYAQGRSNDKVRQIRQPFLKKIFKVLDNNDSRLELDFVYGTLETPKDISLKNANYDNFVPLDGQQRLTTMFLLHWFLALWNEDDFNMMQSHFKGRFAYTTRLSSSDFCAELLEHVCSEEVKQSIDTDTKHPVSSMLKDEGWFHNQWSNDPTISGMLTMLDSMASMFNDIIAKEDREAKAHAFFERLTCSNIDDAAITFNLLYLNRGNFHLSDELYIKMNSRGKPLSDFETFKARFESFMAKHTNVDKDFAKKIDGEWADVFWNLRNNVRPKSEKDNKDYYRDNTDDMIMNVIKVTLANKFAILADNNDNALDELFESQIAKKANPDMRLTFYRYTELGVFNDTNDDDTYEDEEQERQIQEQNEAVCQNVYDTLKFISEIKGASSAMKYQIDKEYVDVDELLNRILFYGIDGKNSEIPGITYQTRLMFWALSEYCIRFRDDIQNCLQPKCTALNRWMRFIRNMVESAEYNNASEMQKALKFLDQLLASMKNSDIIAHLSSMTDIPEDSTPFPQSQLKEEIMKAQLITCDASWENSIDLADNVTSWPGRSGYLFYLSGMSDKSYEEISQWDTATHNNYRSLYDEYKQKMDMLLLYLNNTDFKEECLFERAMLSKGCYLRKEDKRSIIYSMMDQSVSSRSYSFRQMIQFNGIDANNDDSTYKEGVECLKAVLDDNLFCYTDTKQLEQSLRNIIDSSLNAINAIRDWRLPLLENPEIWKEAWQRFMWIDDDTAWVVRQKGGRTNQYETWSYHLYNKLSDAGFSYGYNPHSYPRHTFLNFKDGGQVYQLRISHTPSDEWQFEIIALDEDSNQIEMDSGMKQFALSLVPGNPLPFKKKSMNDAVICAKAIYNSNKKYIK